jgi:hypothetical protein
MLYLSTIYKRCHRSWACSPVVCLSMLSHLFEVHDAGKDGSRRHRACDWPRSTRIVSVQYSDIARGWCNNRWCQAFGMAGRPWRPCGNGAILMALSAGVGRAPRVEGESSSEAWKLVEGCQILERGVEANRGMPDPRARHGT